MMDGQYPEHVVFVTDSMSFWTIKGFFELKLINTEQNVVLFQNLFWVSKLLTPKTNDLITGSKRYSGSRHSFDEN
jgi:hypothetical protein